MGHRTSRVVTLAALIVDMCSSGSGGGGSRGSGPPFGPRCRLFNIGPKVGHAPFFACRPKMQWRIQGTDYPPPWNMDDVTRAMSKGGPRVLVNVFTPPPSGNPVSAPEMDPPPLQKSWIRPCMCPVPTWISIEQSASDSG